MDLPFLGRSKSIVGLDIGSSSVKAVELAIRPKGVELLRVGIAPIPADAIVQGAFLDSGAIVDAIKKAFTNGGIRSKTVTASVAGPAVIVKKVSLPSMSYEELEESIKWEAEQYIPFDINEVNLDFQILKGREGDDQMDVLLVAAKREVIDDYVALIGDAGLKATMIDVDGFAVANAYKASQAEEVDEVVALVNIGAQMVNVNVLTRGIPSFTRDIATGGSLYTEELQKNLSVSFEEAELLKAGESDDAAKVDSEAFEQVMSSVTEMVLGEITRSLDFYAATAAESQITKIVLSGGGGRVKGLADALQERTSLALEPLDPFARMLPSSKFDAATLEALAPDLGVGVGLAMRRPVDS